MIIIIMLFNSTVNVVAGKPNSFIDAALDAEAEDS